ncbi:angiopoietin-like protein 8 isoform X2 [Camelus ferus]|uniref:Angiopoietin-like protein 8 isoform X2 n=2 Tax=Camelus TaxID=9836 RepID=A0A8B7KAS8_CAMFR|nr:angiopoietin-like protein 8 isoform X2 [Camelus bactrianus]XP_014415017.1 angiopoietin-like protein 8 isoform X2 [Camelus ferus]
MPVLMLSLLCTLATVARPAPVASMSSSEPAQHEELTLLFHGALQLSQALNGVYKTTEAQLTEAGDSLGLYGQALGLLGQEVSQGQDAAQELRASLLEMQAHADKQSHIVWALRGHVQRQRQEMVAQQQRLRQIQERLHMAALPA